MDNFQNVRDNCAAVPFVLIYMDSNGPGPLVFNVTSMITISSPKLPFCLANVLSLTGGAL